MSLRRGITIDGLSLTNSIQRESMIVEYEPLSGLDEVWTENLSLHDDLLGYRRVFTFTPDVMTEASAKQLIQVLRSSVVTLTITDPAKGESENIDCQPTFPSVTQILTHSNGDEYWQLSSIILKERAGASV